eukprot:5590375-Pyramimonas_sp.AAC.1
MCCKRYAVPRVPVAGQQCQAPASTPSPRHHPSAQTLLGPPLELAHAMRLTARSTQALTTHTTQHTFPARVVYKTAL